MKSITFIALTLAALGVSQAEDDGQYHPELYGEHRYVPSHNYYLTHRNGRYYNGYQPLYYPALSRELLSPLQVSFGDSYDASFPSTVTYRPPVVTSTYRPPIVTSTYRPSVFPSTYRTPIVTSTYRPFVYSTPKPLSVVKSPSTIYHKSVSDAAASTIREDRTYDENNYHYAYETNNGIAAEESGIVDASPNGAGGTRVRGFYEYIGDDGLKYRVDYIADENGYRASGAHLPKAP